MKIKKIMKAFVAVLLIVCSLMSFVACSDEAEAPSRDRLAKQYETKRYYFRQGYTKDWQITLSGEDGNLVEDYKDQGLALQLMPKAETKDVYYNVFCNWNVKGTSMTQSSADFTSMVMDESGKLAFNKINYVEVREDYNQTSEKATEKIYNKMTWNQVEFSFINGEGEQCKGVWNLLTDGTNFYIVSYEATVAKYDTYFAQFEDMINDFKKIGFEKE